MGVQSRCRCFDGLLSLWRWVLAPTVPVRAQCAASSGEVGGCVETSTALEEQILDAPAPRTAGQVKETVGEVFSQDRAQ